MSSRQSSSRQPTSRQPSRRPKRTTVQQYDAVPQSPRAAMSKRKQPQYQQDIQPQAAQAPAPPVRPHYEPQQYLPGGRGVMAKGVATGAIGLGYGPYSYHANPDQNNGVYNNPRFSQTAASAEMGIQEKPQPTASVPQYLWDKDPDFDDALHNPDPVRDARLDRSFTLFSSRGWINVLALFVILVCLLALFIGYPIVLEYAKPDPARRGFNLGGINGSGQIPDLPNLPKLIDPDTPTEAYQRTGSDGKKYQLVFSDEFNTDGRTFYPGDDPYWEAVDLHYWPTNNLEWYDPSAVTTEGGKLVITMSERPINGLNFMSGMVSSWNKLCFTTGYMEVSVSLPGDARTPGLWPAVWTMGNLGRAGYGASTEGTWPYSYSACDVGTFPNQTDRNGEPAIVATGRNGASPLSFLPGQKLSSCTCPGSDHPGPTTSIGRNAPEIDLLEAQIDTTRFEGESSQSYQIAPFNLNYEFDTSGATLHDDFQTRLNTYLGAEFQQAVSAVSHIPSQFYDGNEYMTVATEFWSNPKKREEGYVSWFQNDRPTWTINTAAVGADGRVQISERIISEEPMYMILNLGMATGFQRPDFQNLKFPAKFRIDHVRVYQRTGLKNALTCDPPSRPTADYIERHIAAYTNPNMTTWAQAGNTFPRNSLYDGC